jgi:uncharacterized protein YjeT (DUF2065 family)
MLIPKLPTPDMCAGVFSVPSAGLTIPLVGVGLAAVGVGLYFLLR